MLGKIDALNQSFDILQDWEENSDERDKTGPGTHDDAEIDEMEITEDMLSSGVPIPSSFVGQTLPSETVRELMKEAFQQMDTNEGEDLPASQDQAQSQHENIEEVLQQEQESQESRPHVVPMPKLGEKPVKEFNEG